MPDQKPLRVLYVEDWENDAVLVTVALKRAGYAVQSRRVTTAAEMEAALQTPAWDVVIADYSLPYFDALQALAVLQRSELDIPFIVVSGSIDEVQAVAALRAGAHDFVTKGSLARLAPAIERELRDAENRRQRRAAEARVHASERRFRALIEHSADAITLVDSAGTVIYDSPAAPQMLGYGPDELLGTNAFDLMHPDDAGPAQAMLRQCLANPALLGQGQLRLRHQNGSWRWVEYKVTNLLPEPSVQAVVVNYRDITSQKRAEEALIGSERRFRALIENSSAAITLFDREGRITYRAPSNTGITGHSDTERLGKPVLDTVHPDDLEALRQSLAAVVQQPQARATLQYRNRHKDGTWRWLEATFTNLLDEPGVNALVGNYRDITENKWAESQIQRQLERLAALRAIDLAITSSLDVRVTLDVFLAQVISQLGVDAANVLLMDPADQMLTYTAGRGFRSSSFRGTRLRLGEGRAGQAALERRIVAQLGPAVLQPASMRTGLLGQENFVSYYGVPLIAKGQVLGVLELFHRQPLQPDPEWLEFLEALAGQAAIALENASLFEGLHRSHQDLTHAYDATIEGWSRALDLRDKETEGHSQRVTALTLRLAQAMYMDQAELTQVRRGALLHDMGKIGIPDQILLKPGSLSDAEWVIMRQHPTYAYELLSPISFLRPALDIPYCHHEKWDGSGYPRGLHGEQIPLAARLFAVVDVWDALRSDRPYRPAWAADRVLAHIQSLSGTHFDPRAVEVFMQIRG